MESKSSKITSVKYHNIFDYKLTKSELVKWRYKTLKETVNGLKNKGRLQREKCSVEKLKIARKVAKLISKIPTVKFVGITGALAMMNAGKNSDIDLMIITSAGKLWLTRLYVYCSLITNHYSLRRPLSSCEKDKLCLNMWLDESDLKWNKDDRNIYTAHEIAQIVPLVNKDNIYEKFLWLNKWILFYWPNSVQILNSNIETLNKFQFLKFNSLNIVSDLVFRISNFFAYRLQYFYMKPKITREIVTSTRAIFHPNDWGKKVLSKLNKSK